MRFAAVSKFLKPFRDVVNETFAAFPGKGNGYSAAMSYNMGFGTKGEYPHVAIDNHKALISYGNAVLPSGLAIAPLSDGFELTWDTSLAEGAMPNDWVVPVLHVDHWQRAVVLDGTLRQTGKCRFIIPHGHSSARCWVYVKAAKSNWDRQYSMSWYGGVIGG
jgi:hypothetical protein